MYEYIEDKRLTWLDDFPLVNTLIVKMLSKLNQNNVNSILIPNVYKNVEDRDFALKLFRKVILNNEKISSEIDGKTPNWDKERIAHIDMIILKLGIVEFLYFQSIPISVTINEYIEIAKEDFSLEGKLNKIGRGLR